MRVTFITSISNTSFFAQKEKSILFSVFELFADIPLSSNLPTGMSYCRCAVAVNICWDEKEGCVHGDEAKGKVAKST